MPLKVAFFCLGSFLGEDSYHSNLELIIVKKWCCMCKMYGETVDHLLQHCKVARTIWDNFFERVGSAWVMPTRLVDFLANWTVLHGNPQTIAMWKMAPLSLMWYLWREMNDRSFIDHEQTTDELRVFFLNTQIFFIKRSRREQPEVTPTTWA